MFSSVVGAKTNSTTFPVVFPATLPVMTTTCYLVARTSNHLLLLLAEDKFNDSTFSITLFFTKYKMRIHSRTNWNFTTTYTQIVCFGYKWSNCIEDDIGIPKTTVKVIMAYH